MNIIYIIEEYNLLWQIGRKWMTISVGDTIPSGTLKRLDEQGISDVHIEEY